MKKTIADNNHYCLELENNLLIGTFKSEILEFEFVKSAVKERLEFCGDKKYPILHKSNTFKNITKEARDYLASEEGCDGLLARAICVKSVLATTVASLFLLLNPPLIPTKIFKDEEKAKEWLQQFIVEN